jgi:hypothetical protein
LVILIWVLNEIDGTVWVVVAELQPARSRAKDSRVKPRIE